MTTNNMTTDAVRRKCVRCRRNTQGSVSRPRKIEIRASERVSNELASIQGLIYRFGRRETMAELFENVMLPALRAHVGKYADAARMERQVQDV